jgi:cytoskeletal protein RodZ
VCNFCYKYIDFAIVPTNNGGSGINPLMDIVQQLQDGGDYASPDKSSSAMSALNDRLAHEHNVAIDIREQSSVKSPTKASTRTPNEESPGAASTPSTQPTIAEGATEGAATTQVAAAQ